MKAGQRAVIMLQTLRVLRKADPAEVAADPEGFALRILEAHVEPTYGAVEATAEFDWAMVLEFVFKLIEAWLKSRT